MGFTFNGFIVNSYVQDRMADLQAECSDSVKKGTRFLDARGDDALEELH